MMRNRVTIMFLKHGVWDDSCCMGIFLGCCEMRIIVFFKVGLYELSFGGFVVLLCRFRDRLILVCRGFE